MNSRIGKKFVFVSFSRFCKRFLSVLLVLCLFWPPAASGEKKVFLEGETEPFPEGAELLTLRVAGLLGADCMLLTLGNRSMFVDLGTTNSLKQVRELIDAAGISHVDYFFNSHPHNDHIGGFIPLLESGFSVGAMYTVFPHNYIGYCVLQNRSVRAAEQYNIPVIDLKTEDSIDFGDAQIVVCRVPDRRITRVMGPNDLSAMLVVKYGDCSILLSADVEDRAQRILCEEYSPMLKADIMKYPHHGLTRAEPAFIKAVSPEFVFFTNYPQRTVAALKQMISCGVNRFSFSCWGVTTLQTDGRKWIVHQDVYPEKQYQVRHYHKSHPRVNFPFSLP